MARKEKVQFAMLVDPEDPTTLILQPINHEIQDNSTYTINIKDLEFEDETTFSSKETFSTKPDYCFISVDDVNSMLSGLNIPEEYIMKHIIGAGRTAMHWAKYKADEGVPLPDFNDENFKDDYYPFFMFIKFHALANALKEFYIELLAHPFKWKDALSDLEREEEMDLDAIKGLIDDFTGQADEWLELVVTITADPKWALRGKYCYSTYNMYSTPYHRTGWSNHSENNFKRGF